MGKSKGEAGFGVQGLRVLFQICQIHVAFIHPNGDVRETAEYMSVTWKSVNSGEEKFFGGNGIGDVGIIYSYEPGCGLSVDWPWIKKDTKETQDT